MKQAPSKITIYLLKHKKNHESTQETYTDGIKKHRNEDGQALQQYSWISPEERFCSLRLRSQKNSYKIATKKKTKDGQYTLTLLLHAVHQIQQIKSSDIRSDI